jgi:hypothetical protein
VANAISADVCSVAVDDEHDVVRNRGCSPHCLLRLAERRLRVCIFWRPARLK